MTAVGRDPSPDPTTHTVVLTTSDGVSTTVACPPTATVLDAAEAAGLLLRARCSNGNCGRCAAIVRSGPYHMDGHSPRALSPRTGAVLLCRVHADGDCVIELPYDRSRILDVPPPERSATITALESLAPELVRLELTLEPDGQAGSTADFEPGQFVQLQVPGRDERRTYSLANTPNWDGILELLVRIVPGGLFSNYLESEASIGDPLIVHGPRGTFRLQERGLRPRWFVAGGMGLVPVLSMLRRMADWGDPQPARLYHGCTTAEDVFGGDQIATIAPGLTGFEATVCVRRPGAAGDWTGFVGTPADALRRDLEGIDEWPDFYLCGPPAMVESVEEALSAAGVPCDRLVVERITAS
jgi:ferredoxin-NADP reductase/ferredoxin